MTGGGAPSDYHRRRWRSFLGRRWQGGRRQKSVNLCNPDRLAVTALSMSYGEKFTINTCSVGGYYLHAIYTVLQKRKPPIFWQKTFTNLNRFLPARRYASTGNSDRNLSVCPSLCPSRASIASKRRKKHHDFFTIS